MGKLQKHLVKRLFNQKYKIELNSDHLNDIDSFYSTLEKDAIMKNGFFRFINMSLSIVFIIVFFLLKGTWVDEWIFMILMTLFGLYNFIHCVGNFIQYKKIKRTKIDHD